MNSKGVDETIRCAGKSAPFLFAYVQNDPQSAPRKIATPIAKK